MRFAVNLTGMVSTFILARLLTPDDFGVVALAGSAYAFFGLLGQFGFDSALIHNQSADDEHYHSAWTANILVGAFISAMMFVVAKPAAWFFDDPRIEYVVYAFSLLSLAKGFENIGVVNFRKSLQFRGDFLYFVIPKLAGVIVGVSVAFVIRNYWALVIGMVTSQVATLLYSHFSQPFRPRFSLSKISDLFDYSRWIVITNGLRYLSTNGIDILLGKLRDASAVGIFGIAKQIAFLPSNELLAPVNRALFPGFASVSDEPDRLCRILSRVIAVTALISIPAAFGIVVLAQLLVDVILGDKWHDVGPVLGVLGIAGLVIAMRSALGPVLMARGLPKALTMANVAQLIVILPAVLVLVPRMGVVGVAYASLGSAMVTTPTLLTAVKRDIGFGWGELGRCVWRPFVAGCIMAAIVDLCQPWFVAQLGESFWSLLCLIGIGAIVFAGCLWCIWAMTGFADGAESEILQQVRQRLSRAS